MIAALLWNLLTRVTDARMAFPDILLAIALMAALDVSLTDVVIAFGAATHSIRGCAG